MDPSTLYRLNMFFDYKLTPYLRREISGVDSLRGHIEESNPLDGNFESLVSTSIEEYCKNVGGSLTSVRIKTSADGDRERTLGKIKRTSSKVTGLKTSVRGYSTLISGRCCSPMLLTEQRSIRSSSSSSSSLSFRFRSLTFNRCYSKNLNVSYKCQSSPSAERARRLEELELERESNRREAFETSFAYERECREAFADQLDDNRRRRSYKGCGKDGSPKELYRTGDLVLLRSESLGVHTATTTVTGPQSVIDSIRNAYDELTRMGSPGYLNHNRLDKFPVINQVYREYLDKDYDLHESECIKGRHRYNICKWVMNIILLSLYERALLTLQDLSESSDEYADCKALSVEISKHFATPIKLRLTRHGIGVTRDLKCGFDTEFKEVDGKGRVDKISAQLAILGRVVIKVPSNRVFELSTLNTQTGELYATPLNVTK